MDCFVASLLAMTVGGDPHAAQRHAMRPVPQSVLTSADKESCGSFALFYPSDSSHIPAMAKHPDTPKKPTRSKTPNSKASRPDVQPIGPALAELLNPAINRGESGLGSSTGLQPPPDNSWDRRSGGEAAAHRARASTRGTSDDVAKRDSASSSSPPHAREARGGEGSGVGGGSASSLCQRRSEARVDETPPPPTPPRRFAEGGENKKAASANPRSANSRRPITAPPRPSRRSIPNWQNNSASPPRRKTPPRWRGRRATRWRRSASPRPPMRWKA